MSVETTSLGRDHVRSHQPQRPTLLFFHSRASGRCRRVHGYLSQVLQRRRNHDTFRVVQVDVEDHPELAAHFGVTRVPTIIVLEGSSLLSRVVEPSGRAAVQAALASWLH